MVVRPLVATDLASWAPLFRGYRDSYRLAPDETVVERVWTWLHDEGTPVRGLVAELDGALVGMAHYRAFHRPSTGTIGTYLDDLFTDPAARGRGVARALLGRLGELAAGDGRSVVRWITAADNETAQRVYDDVATRTTWVTYDLSAPASRRGG